MRKIALILAAAVLLAAALTACARRRNEPEADAAQTTQDEPKPEEEGQNGGTGAAQTEAAELSFASFDGGGPEYSVEIGDTDLISCERGVFYAKPDHDSMPGAGYTVTFTFRGLRPGETEVTVKARSPIAENYDAVYRASVDKELNVTLELLRQRDRWPGQGETAALAITVGDRTYHAVLTDNPTTQALIGEMEHTAASVFFEDNGGFEKVCELPWSFPESSEELTVGPGDVVLYQGDKLCVYYGENTWSLTPVAKIEGVTREELLDAFGDEADALLELVWLD